MDSKRSRRRQFLKNGAALAGLAAMPSPAGRLLGSETTQPRPEDLHAYGGRSRFEDSLRTGTVGLWPPGGAAPGSRMDYGLRSPLQNQVGILTPPALHFVVSHSIDPPDIDPGEHRLLIHGLVDHPLIFTLDDLKRLPRVTRVHFIECHGNSAPTGPTGAARKAAGATGQDTHGLTSCSEWTGVELSLLLKEAGVQKGAGWVVAEGAEPERHSKSIPLEKALDDCLVAYGQNGEAVRPDQGYPLRLIVPGWQGINNVKWLRRVKVVDEPYMAMRESTKYPSLRLDGNSRWFESEMGTKSVILRPSGGERLPGPGFYEITGLAWSGGGSIRRVEISVDGGHTWKDAKLQQPVYRKAHTCFGLGWTWNGEDVVLQSRSTDDQGQVQPTLAELGKLWGVDLDYFKSNSTAVMGNTNAIQPWKITRDGSVLNALV